MDVWASSVPASLRKDPAQRLRDIADGRFQIEEVLNDPRALTTVVAATPTYREWAAWIAAALFLGTTLFFGTRSSTTTSSRDAISFPVFPSEKAEFSARISTTLNVPSFALSPDGHALVFSAATPGGRPMLREESKALSPTACRKRPRW